MENKCPDETAHARYEYDMCISRMFEDTFLLDVANLSKPQ